MGGCASKPKKKHNKYEDNKNGVDAQAKVYKLKDRYSY